MSSYLVTGKKKDCFGCEACQQVCPIKAIVMVEDEEGFRYPNINKNKCNLCSLCQKTCPLDNRIKKYKETQIAFGGSAYDGHILDESTSGGAFSAITKSWYRGDDVVFFGAEAKGLEVRHTSISDSKQLYRIRKSKYTQSHINGTYKEVKDNLHMGKKVLYSGTPCQIAGLLSVLKNDDKKNLLTIEVFCEGVPSPHFIRKYEDWIKEKFGFGIQTLDYRHKGMRKPLENPTSGRWDFEVMCTTLQNGRQIKTDRWFSPFWSLWLDHLMSRPSCYHCPFTTPERVADLSLGDLWGVHVKWPELYKKNRGASLVVCNTMKGKEALNMALPYMDGHMLDFKLVKTKAVMSKCIEMNPLRTSFMKDLRNEKVSYKDLCKKWYKTPSVKLLVQKYIYGNRQKVALWKLKSILKRNVK